VNSHAPYRKMLTRTSQPRRVDGLLLVLVNTGSELRWPSSTSSLQSRSFARRKAGHAVVGSPHWLPAVGRSGARQSRCHCWLVATTSLYTDALQTDVPVERQSPVFPRLSLGHSLRCFSRARRHSAFCFALSGALRVWVSKEKISRATTRDFGPQCGRDFCLRSLRRKTRLRHLGAGHLASLRARVSRVTFGQIQTGEMTWHSTKTRSL
jgi:hypothetical protein